MKSTRYRLPWIPLAAKRAAYNALRRKDAEFLRDVHRRQGGLIYLHIPKAGGNSIERALGLRKTGHRPLRMFELAIPPAEFRDAFKFTFLRDPWTRLASAFHYLRTEGATAEDRAWARANIDRFESFREFVTTWVTPESVYAYIHLIPQHEFLVDWSGEVKLDFIGRLATIQDDYARLVARLGRGDAGALGHRNRTVDAGRYDELYDREMVDIVARAYARDIELFDFAPPERAA